MQEIVNNLFPHDTTYEATLIRFSILRRIGNEERAMMAIELSDNLQAIIEEGIRKRHSDYNNDKVKLEAIRLAIGEQLFQKAYAERNENK